MNPRSMRSWIRWTVLAGALLCLTLYSYSIRRWMLDDSFISFRYAENLADGHGPVYNPGERVEGYTTFLWMVLLSAGYRFGLDTVLLSRVLGVAAAVGSLLLLAWSDRTTRLVESRVAMVAVLLVGTSATFLTWGMSGMETSLTALLVLLACLVFLRSSTSADRHLDLLAGCICALAAMTRPDAGLLFATLFSGRALEWWRRRQPGWMRLAIGFTALYLPYFLWRYLYYGWLLPNTFYAKVDSTWAQILRGWEYFGNWVSASLLLLLPLLIVPFLWRRLAPAYRLRLEIWVFLLLHTAYVVAVGGDIMPSFRFFAPILPVVGLCSAAVVVGLARRAPVVWSLAALIAGFNLWQFTHNGNYLQWIHKIHVAERGRVSGLYLRDAVPADTLLATNNAGAVPYYSRLPVIDMLGLNDLEIAHTEIAEMGTGFAGHEKANGPYVLSRRPDLVLFGSALGSRAPRFRSDQELYALPEFHQQYRFEKISLPDKKVLRIYVRKDRSLLP